MKIVGINSSLRRESDPLTQHKSFTRELLQIALNHVARKYPDTTVELVDLGDYRIAFERGAYSSNENFSQMCYPPDDDDMSRLYDKMIEADGVLFSSPTYWGYPSGLLKAFIDRLTAMDEISDDPARRRLQGKVAGAITTAKFDGSSRVAQDILSMANYLGFVIPPHAFAFHTGRMTTSVLEDDAEFDANYFARRNAQAVAENVYRMIRTTQGLHWTNFQEFTHPLSEEARKGVFNLERERKFFLEQGCFHQMNQNKNLVDGESPQSTEEP